MKGNAPRRKSLRLPGYDYSRNGAYFLTLCVKGRRNLFGYVIDGEMNMNSYGGIVTIYWNQLPFHYNHIHLDAFIVMPNHAHGIIMIEGAGLKPAPTHALPEVVRAFKTFSSREINTRRDTQGQPVWQRGYFEHVIRDDAALNRIREYIATNPLRWDFDRENLQAKGQDEFDRWLSNSKSSAK